MKTKLTLLAFLLALAALLPSCHKETMQKELQLSELSVTSYGSVADISITATYPGKLTATLYISQSQDMCDALIFTDEKNITNDLPNNFIIRATGLQNATDYWCQVEVGNEFLSKKTEILKFTSLTTDIDYPNVYNSIYVSVSNITFKMLPVARGTFTMGATSEQGSDADSDEKPAHSVTLSDFYLGETEVTQALWQAVMGDNPSKWSGNNLPVEKVSWNDCQEFVTKLNTMLSSQLGGKRFSLPTEAEWEYAARGGQKSKGYEYSGSNNIGDVAWYNDNSGGKTHPVAQKQPNELGLYDMSGNVWEWCAYSGNTQYNPTGSSSGSYRGSRGGSWSSSAGGCRVSCGISINPDFRINFLGLRLLLR